jgi:hypothetical protein
MESTTSASSRDIVEKTMKHLDEAANSWLRHRIARKLPLKIRNTLLAGKMKHQVPLVADLPIIHSRMIRAVDSFCEPDSARVAIFELPMRCYVECLDIFRQRHFKVIYELVDKWEAMWEGHKIRRATDEAKLIAQADLVTATSKMLVRELVGTYPSRRDILYLPNGVRRELFDTHRTSMPYDAPPGGSLTVGYFGSVCEWFDFETMEYLSDHKPEWNFVVIGEHPTRPEFPVQKWNRLASKSNLYALGRKKQSQLIDYLALWDVCIIPFTYTALTQATSPVKVYEYLSAYKPVVTFESEEMKGFPYVYQAKDKETFLLKIQEANSIPIDKERIDAFLSKNTWRNRAQTLLQRVGSPIERVNNLERGPTNSHTYC